MNTPRSSYSRTSQQEHREGQFTLLTHLIDWTGLRQVFCLSERGISLSAYWCPHACSASFVFNQDGVPSHYGRCVPDHLHREFLNRWIGRGGFRNLLIYLSTVNFFLLNTVKSLVCETPVNSEYWPGGTNIDRYCYDLWNVRYFRTCLPIHITLVSYVHLYQWLQFLSFYDAFMSHFLFIIVFCVIKFLQNIVCCDLTVFVFLYLIRVTFQPMLSYVFKSL